MHDMHFPYCVGYGMTECAPLITYEKWQKYLYRSCGKGIVGMELRIDSEDPTKKEGELQVRGVNVMAGYYILEQKITMPLLGALASVSDEEAARVRGLVKDIDGNPEYRDEIVDFVKDNGGLDAARAELDAYVEEAVKALDVLPDCFEKECLVELAYFTAKRIM